MHALSVLSSDLPSWDQMQTTKRLQAFSQAHSRAVLLLQSMVHSSSLPAPSELDDPRWKLSNAAQTSGLRELAFPAPLSYFDPNNAPKRRKSKNKHPQSHVPQSSPSVLTRQRVANSVVSNADGGKHRKWELDSAVTQASPARNNTQRSRRTSRISFFGGQNRPPPPPPSSEPESLRLYSGSWKRGGHLVSASTTTTDEERVLRPPNRRFVTSTYSSETSLGSSPTQSTSLQGSTPSNSSPHDLLAATSRTRAPILRVFVPCSHLTEDVIASCEDQLIEDGLWDHLSVGDVVCNFGYVPPIEDSDFPGLGSNGSATGDSSGSQSNSNGKDDRRWLIYTGDRLTIYIPSLPVPIPDALTLPSPFYYSHILPPLANPRFILRLPPLYESARYALTKLTSVVVSPQSCSGYARVRTFAWLASVDARGWFGNGTAPAPAAAVNGLNGNGVNDKNQSVPPLMSNGWRGEWVLQGEGTREGRQFLQKALKYGSVTPAEWEIVRDKSGSGKLWLRYVPSVSSIITYLLTHASINFSFSFEHRLTDYC